MTPIEQRLTKCFSAVFPRLSGDEVSAASMDSVTGWDSLASVTLLTVVEEEFGVAIEPEELENLLSFDAYRRYLTEREAAVNAG